jgi:hypothetical protein
MIGNIILWALLAHSSGPPDTLYTQGRKVPCTVKEVTPTIVRYVHQGEEALYTVAVAALDKIVFASGRVAVLAAMPTQKNPPSLAARWVRVYVQKLIAPNGLACALCGCRQ